VSGLLHTLAALTLKEECPVTTRKKAESAAEAGNKDKNQPASRNQTLVVQPAVTFLPTLSNTYTKMNIPC
jgi:hypothetical protein